LLVRYGKHDVTLKLGTAFHRSHIEIVASQVSAIPAEMTMRWDKQRRFAAAWSLIRDIGPSQLLTTKRTAIDGAGEAFERLCEGRTVAAEIVYSTDKRGRGGAAKL
jgi:hypothetical protein